MSSANKKTSLTMLPRCFVFDRLCSIAFTCIAFSTGLLFVLILLFLASEAMPLVQSEGWQQILGLEWFPLDKLFGMLPMMLGSFFVVIGLSLVAVPIALFCAVGLSRSPDRPTWFNQCFYSLLQICAGIPSVIFGFWGLTVIVPMIARWQPPGASLAGAIIILSLMVLPTLIITFTVALQSVPRSLILGAQALALSPWTTLWAIELPSAKFGLYNGLILGLTRALGETMAVVMVAGNVVQIPTSLFQPVRVLTANIALEMAYAMDVHRASLFASGLFLTATIALLSWFASHVTHVHLMQKASI